MRASKLNWIFTAIVFLLGIKLAAHALSADLSESHRTLTRTEAAPEPSSEESNLAENVPVWK